jgi:hypothetical protein
MKRSGGVVANVSSKWDDEKMLDPEFAQKEQLVSRRGEKPGRLAGRKTRMGCDQKDDHRGAVDGSCISECPLDDGAMAECTPSKTPNSEHDRPGDRPQGQD